MSTYCLGEFNCHDFWLIADIQNYLEEMDFVVAEDIKAIVACDHPGPDSLNLIRRVALSCLRTGCLAAVGAGLMGSLVDEVFDEECILLERDDSIVLQPTTAWIAESDPVEEVIHLISILGMADAEKDGNILTLIFCLEDSWRAEFIELFKDLDRRMEAFFESP